MVPPMRRIFNLCAVFSVLGGGFCVAEVRPLEKRGEWTFGDGKAWEWKGEGRETTLSLVRQSDFKPKVRSPFNLAWFGGGEWGSFVLTAEVRLDLFNEGNNDVCIAFGKESETKFYYAHLGEKSDAVHLQLHLVNDADRKAITTEAAKELPWKPETWHRVKIERDAESGVIQVWFDGEKVLSAEDKTLGKGAVGLGSFDDLGSFRNVVISAK